MYIVQRYESYSLFLTLSVKQMLRGAKPSKAWRGGGGAVCPFPLWFCKYKRNLPKFSFIQDPLSSSQFMSDLLQIYVCIYCMPQKS